MEGIVCKKKEATGAVGYCILFGLALILVITTMYIAMASKLMSEQHTIDDALSDLETERSHITTIWLA